MDECPTCRQTLSTCHVKATAAKIMSIDPIIWNDPPHARTVSPNRFTVVPVALGIVDVQIHHLLGEFSVGEDLVYVLVAGSHREYIFPVLEEAVERYKKEAPIFKKETVITEKERTKAYWTSEQ